MPLRLFGNGGKPGSDMLMLEEEMKIMMNISLTVSYFFSTGSDKNWVVISTKS